ncbi:MAG: OmpA family protein [Bacteroidetes bacterium]|nr:OmpA family protein [Bacteroidota bacterium]
MKNKMKKVRECAVFFLLTGILVFTGNSAFSQNDAEGSKDPSLFTRMPGYHIYRYDDLQFDQYEFKVSDNKTQIVQGHSLFIIYEPNDNIQAPSPLQIGHNYINAAKSVGGMLVYEFHDPGEDVVVKVVKNNMETWAYITANGNGSYSIHLIEKEAMKQDVVADASAMNKSIKESGKATLYGIYFDTGKADVKPESQAALKEIAKLLQSDAGLKLYVVGHTDNKGTLEANMKLSQDRAIAIVNTLVNNYSVAASRLKACGDGPTAPVASNDSEAGRSLNRRVELVKQ